MGLLDSQSEQQYYDGNNFGGYQFVSLDSIISAFRFIYVGEGKIISKAKGLPLDF